jgi:hypothetical protein
MAGYTSALLLSASIIKQNDNFPALVLTFQDNSEGSMGPVDLTNATTIKVVLKGQNTSTLVVGTCTPLEASHGTATFAWTQSNTSVADSYAVEGNIVWASSAGSQTFPNAAANNPTLEIDAQLDAGSDL